MNFIAAVSAKSSALYASFLALAPVYQVLIIVAAVAVLAATAFGIFKLIKSSLEKRAVNARLNDGNQHIKHAEKALKENNGLEYKNQLELAKTAFLDVKESRNGLKPHAEKIATADTRLLAVETDLGKIANRDLVTQEAADVLAKQQRIKDAKEARDHLQLMNEKRLDIEAYQRAQRDNKTFWQTITRKDIVPTEAQVAEARAKIQNEEAAQLAKHIAPVAPAQTVVRPVLVAPATKEVEVIVKEDDKTIADVKRKVAAR